MGKTISQRWWAWHAIEPVWCNLAGTAFALAMFGLIPMHLMGLMGAVGKTVGLWMLIGFDAILLFITAFRKQWWWFTFFCYITIGVIGWELASYFLG